MIFFKYGKSPSRITNTFPNDGLLDQKENICTCSQRKNPISKLVPGHADSLCPGSGSLLFPTKGNLCVCLGHTQNININTP